MTPGRRLNPEIDIARDAGGVYPGAWVADQPDGTRCNSRYGPSLLRINRSATYKILLVSDTPVGHAP